MKQFGVHPGWCTYMLCILFSSYPLLTSLVEVSRHHYHICAYVNDLQKRYSAWWGQIFHEYDECFIDPAFYVIHIEEPSNCTYSTEATILNLSLHIYSIREQAYNVQKITSPFKNPIQCCAVIFLPNPHNKHPVKARYGMPLVIKKSHSISATVIPVPYVIS